MKRTITVGELRRRCEKRKPGRIILNAEDQNQNSAGNSIRFNLEFNTMAVFLNPDTIYLKNGANCVYFQRIRRIIIDDDMKLHRIVYADNTLSGFMLHIICDSENSDGTEVRYTLIDTQTEHLV